MVYLNPQSVRFGAVQWQGVSGVVVDRSAARIVEEWSDRGPHAVLVDIAEARIVVRVEHAVGSEADAGPTPGMIGELVVESGPSGSDLRRKRWRAQCVIVGISHTLNESVARRTITLRAVSSNGSTDPIIVESV